MDSKPSDDSYSDKETARRMDATLKRMLNTPPQPRKTEKKKPRSKKPRGK